MSSALAHAQADFFDKTFAVMLNSGEMPEPSAIAKPGDRVLNLVKP